MPLFDRLEFHVEQWDAADVRLERVIAAPAPKVRALLLFGVQN